jgi:hypothetical protein
MAVPTRWTARTIYDYPPFVGTTTPGLTNLTVQPGEGVDGRRRSILYAATRARSPIGDRLVTELNAGAPRISRERQIRDEVDRRVAILRVVGGLASEPIDRDLIEVVRLAHAEPLSVARITADPELAARILAVTARLVRTTSVAGAALSTADALRLTPRGTAVLAQVTLGCSYAEVGKRLALEKTLVCAVGIYGPVGAFLPELFVSLYRYTSAGMACNLGALVGGGITPLVAASIIAGAGSASIGFLLAEVSVVSLIATFGLPETRGIDLVTADIAAGKAPTRDVAGSRCGHTFV